MKKSMTRREALKRFGAVAVGTAFVANDFASVGGIMADKTKMKVLAINGSSRKDGNTADMLRLVLGELSAAGHETELVQLGGETVNPWLVNIFG